MKPYRSFLLSIVLSFNAVPQSIGPPSGPATALDAILRAHHAWTTPPASVRIIGTLTRGKTTEPIKITATAEEEALVESGTSKLVATTSSRFQDKDGKITPEPTLSGFSQLDVTGLFFLAQLAVRPVSVASPVAAVTPGGAGRRVHVRSNRSQLHYGRLRVIDEADFYTGSDGLLAGISRSFYESLPRFKFSQAYAFSDYRDTNGVLLPYRIDRYLKGRVIETITVTSYEFDVPAAPTLFTQRGTR